MARTAEGWRLVADPRTGIYNVRFTLEGRRRTYSTGERDSGEAAKVATRIYAEAVSGRLAPGRARAPGSTESLMVVAASWLASIEPKVDKRTFDLYTDTYVGRHFAPFFGTLDRLTTASVDDYSSERLRKVTRETLKKELSALRRLARWAHVHGHLAQMPEIETPDRRVVGTSAPSSRKRQFLIFTADEIARVLGHLPERALNKRNGETFPVRARFVVAWETTLRPATLDKLRTPVDYRPGAEGLLIEGEDDKNRFRRDLPLSPEARAALDAVCPADGIIFGKHDYRACLRRAAKAAGIDEYRANRISDYDFRHSRITYFGRVSDNLAGIMYMAGHKQPATTARYMRPQKDAAIEVLKAAAAAGSPEHDRLR